MQCNAMQYDTINNYRDIIQHTSTDILSYYTHITLPVCIIMIMIMVDTLMISILEQNDMHVLIIGSDSAANKRTVQRAL